VPTDRPPKARIGQEQDQSAPRAMPAKLREGT